MRKVNFFTKIKEIQENIQREMHTQMDSLEYAYLVEEKTHFERMGIIQYLTILTIFTAAVFLLTKTSHTGKVCRTLKIQQCRQ